MPDRRAATCCLYCACACFVNNCANMSVVYPRRQIFRNGSLNPCSSGLTARTIMIMSGRVTVANCRRTLRDDLIGGDAGCNMMGLALHPNRPNSRAGLGFGFIGYGAAVWKGSPVRMSVSGVNVAVPWGGVAFIYQIFGITVGRQSWRIVATLLSEVCMPDTNLIHCVQVCNGIGGAQVGI